MKLLKPFLLALSLAAFASIALAADTPPPDNLEAAAIYEALLQDDANIFQTFLDTIFGGGTTTKQNFSVLGDISKVLNISVLLFVLLLTAYKGLQYGIHTALKGVSGGHQVNPFWAAMVTSISVLMVLPLGNGYSSIQYFTHKVATAGAWVADQAANKGVEWVDDGGAITPKTLGASNEFFYAALRNASCAHYANTKVFKDTDTHVKLFIGYTPDQKAYVASWELERNDAEGFAPDKTAFNNFCGELRVTKKEPISWFQKQLTTIWGKSGAALNGNSDYKNKANELAEAKFTAEAAAIKTLAESLDKTLGPLVNSAIDASQTYQLAGNAKANAELVAGLKAFKDIATISDDDIQKASAEGEAIEATLNTLLSKVSQRPAIINMAVDELQSTRGEFEGKIEEGASKAARDYRTVVGENGKKWFKEVKERGFAVLGGFYYTISIINERIHEIADFSGTARLPTYSAGDGSYTNLFAREEVRQYSADLNNFFDEHTNYYDNNHITTIDQTGYEFTGDGEFTDASSAWRAFGNEFSEGMGVLVHSAFSGDRDILISMQNLGYYGGAIVGPLFLGAGAVELAGDAAEAAGALNPKAALLGSLLSKIGATGKYIMGALFIAFSFLAYYLPAIPMIEWLMALMGYLITYLTALLVLPIWAGFFAFATGDEGWESGHVRQGLVLLAGLLLRPPLMVMIFFGIMVLTKISGIVCGWLVDYMLAIGSTHIMGLMGWVFMIVITAVFCYQMLVRLFGLLTDLPDRMMQGLNLGHETFGTQGDEREGRTMIIGSLRGAGTVLQGASKTPKAPKEKPPAN